jgi:hypothetical protein
MKITKTLFTCTTIAFAYLVVVTVPAFAQNPKLTDPEFFKMAKDAYNKNYLIGAVAWEL